jgi:hypothetical protein
MHLSATSAFFTMPNVRHEDKRAVNLWIDVELKDAAIRQAEKLGLSTTEYIARCIDRGLRSTKTKSIR